MVFLFPQSRLCDGQGTQDPCSGGWLLELAEMSPSSLWGDGHRKDLSGGGALLALEEGVAGQKEAELKPRNKIQGCCLLLVTLGKGFICFLTKVVQPGG